jgi:hypothetical protein
MAARAAYFSGQLEVQVVLNRTGFGQRTGADPGTPKAADSGTAPDMLPVGGTATAAGPGAASSDTPGADPNSPGAGGRGGGHRHGGASPGSPAGGSRGDNDAAPQLHGSTLPAVSFHVRLVNRAAYPVEVEVVDFNSDLGDFVVEPEKLVLAPGATADTEPMSSRLGVTSDAIPLTVSIRYKGQAPEHTREKQVLVLRPAPAPAENPMAPPPLRFN